MTAGTPGVPDGGDEVAGFGAATTAVTVEGTLRWSCCGHSSSTPVRVHRHRRLEGASDAEDLLVTVSVPCPACGRAGVGVLGSGPGASAEDLGVLERLELPPDPAVT